MSAFFFQRINDHIQYLRKLEKTLRDEGDFQGTAHTDCKLGKWMYGDGRAEAEAEGAEALQLFEGMFSHHQAFHDAGHRALDAKAAGDADGVKAAVTEMIKLSNTLIDILTTLDKISTSNSRK